MIQPIIDEIASSRTSIDVFKGYNHNIKIAENEFFDMKNLSSVNYPVLSLRLKRGVYPFSEGSVGNNPQGLISKDALCYIDGRHFVINDLRIDLELSESAEMCPKQLVSMGAYVIIMPDKKYINTADLDDYGDIEASYPSAGMGDYAVTFSLCKADGTLYENYTISAAEPSDAQNNDLWMDTSSSPHTLKQFSSVNNLWTPIATTYIRISSYNIAARFKQYDGVKISGIASSLTQLKDLNDKVSVLYDVHHDTDNPLNDYIVVIGVLDDVVTQEVSIFVARQMPKLDFVIESNNRLWGCRYGEDINGNIVNEIYASKQGDFKNWNCFMGISTDSYTASCGTDGRWTGAVNYLGYPLFFKENFLHKVFGSYPAQFQIQSTACRGVQKGAGDSLAIVNEKLFYKSNNGVCVYDGSLPTEISTAFGDIHYTGIDSNMISEWNSLRSGAVAGAFNNKYYISMKSEIDGEWYLFVFDSSVGIWHKEDNTRVGAFCASRGEMYFIDRKASLIKTVLGSGIPEESKIKWLAESGVIGTSMPDKKYISRLLVRMSVNAGTLVNFFIQYDSSGVWEKVYTAVGTKLKSYSIPIKPKRCDHFKIKIEGEGDIKIFSIVKTIEQGSDL